MKGMNRRLTMALTGLLCLIAVTAVPAQVPRGVAITPRNFPDHTMADVDHAFRLAREVGRHAVFIYQWGELNRDIVKMMLAKAARSGLVAIVGLSPTTLDQGRKELDLPAPLRMQAGSNLSFSNPAIRAAYMRAAIDLARLKPPYLCLATEINLLALQRLPEYLHFVSLYKETYRAVKRISPATTVFVTFQWEWVRILDAREPRRIAEHSKLIHLFRPELDLVGFTTYPSPFHETPARLPPDYYTWMFRHIQPREPVMFMEAGWPTSGSGSEAEQLDYLERLPALLKGINLVGFEWALLHDVQIGSFDANLNTVGLRYRDGRPKPGYGAFRALTGP
jgi:hypothetical protein